MLLALLFLFQHVILPDMPTVDKNPYTSENDIAQGAEALWRPMRGMSRRRMEMEAKVRIWRYLRFRAALPTWLYTV